MRPGHDDSNRENNHDIEHSATDDTDQNGDSQIAQWHSNAGLLSGLGNRVEAGHEERYDDEHRDGRCNSSGYRYRRGLATGKQRLKVAYIAFGDRRCTKHDGTDQHRDDNRELNSRRAADATPVSPDQEYTNGKARQQRGPRDMLLLAADADEIQWFRRPLRQQRFEHRSHRDRLERRDRDVA